MAGPAFGLIAAKAFGVGFMNSVGIAVLATTASTSDQSAVRVALYTTIGGVVATSITAMGMVLSARGRSSKEVNEKEDSSHDSKDVVITGQSELLDQQRVMIVMLQKQCEALQKQLGEKPAKKAPARRRT